MKHIMIIGGGASGLVAAITIAQQAHLADTELKLTVLEHEDKIGKKLLATGNGHCNFTNEILQDDCYHSDDPSFPMRVIRNFDREQTVRFFEQIGIVPKVKKGCYYPYSGQASQVVDALLCECESYGVTIRTNTHASNVLYENDQFTVVTNSRYQYSCDGVILACGSPAGHNNKLGASGYSIAESLGHTVYPVLPALTALRSNQSFFTALSGIRMDACVKILCEARVYTKERGELQFTDYGISGIPVFQVSGCVSELLAGGKEVMAELDLFPEMNEEETERFFRRRCQMLSHREMKDFFTGIFPDALSKVLRKLADISSKQRAECLEEEELCHLLELIKHFPVPVVRTNTIKQSQVARGGVAVSQINPDTMESLLVPGLYFTGELLNVDGLCGGYNLQFAWSSGYLAGMDAFHSIVRE